MVFHVVFFLFLSGTYPILVMTFMNAPVDFWCSRPDHLSHLEPADWRRLSGQVQQEQDEQDVCRILDLDFQAQTEEGLRCAPATGSRQSSVLTKISSKPCSFPPSHLTISHGLQFLHLTPVYDTAGRQKCRIERSFLMDLMDVKTETV